MGHKENESQQISIHDRVSKLLESHEWSDCSFVIDGRIFKAHRLILAISSPVFKAMLYGPLATSEEIVIRDVEPDAFQMLITYVYTDKVKILSIEKAFELLYAAKKYMLEHLCKKCISYIKANLSVDNVVSVLNFSDYVQEEPLKSCSLKLFCQHADYILKETAININSICLRLILSSDEMNISELNLIKFVFKWTTGYCKLYNIPMTIENRHRILEENGLKQLLRFTALSETQLDEVVADDYNILFSDETTEIKESIVAKKYPECVPRNRLDLSTEICHRSILRSAKPLQIDFDNNTVCIAIKANKTVFLDSLCVPTRMSSEINYFEKTSTYSEEFLLTLIKTNDKSVIKSLNFMNTVDYDSNVYIMFSEPCVLKSGLIYELYFTWPNNMVRSFKYIVSYRELLSKSIATFQFADYHGSNNCGSFLESLKFSL